MDAFLGIQISNSDIIPIDVRYIDNTKIVFSIPPNNAKQEYSVSGIINADLDIGNFKTILEPFIRKFTDNEKKKFQMGNSNKQGIESSLGLNYFPQRETYNENMQRNLPNENFHLPPHIYKLPSELLSNHQDDNEMIDENLLTSSNRKRLKFNDNLNLPAYKKSIGELNLKTDHIQNHRTTFVPYNYENENLKPNYGYKGPSSTNFDLGFKLDEIRLENTPDYCIRSNYVREVSTSNETVEEKKNRAYNLLINGNKLYETDFYNGENSVKGLEMLRQSQIIYQEIYPESFSKIVLPGTSKEFIRSLDPDAEIMSPKQFFRFMKRRIKLAELKKKGLITKRVSGIRYPNRSKHALNRTRNELGIFIH